MRNLRNEVRRIVQEELSHNRARLTESVNPSYVRTAISTVKKKLMRKWEKIGGYENFGQEELFKMKSKFGYNPYGTPDEREIAKILDGFDNWAMNYDGNMREIKLFSESVITEGISDGYYFVEYGRSISTLITDKRNLTFEQAIRRAQDLAIELQADGRLGATKTRYVGVSSYTDNRFAITYVHPDYISRLDIDHFDGSYANYNQWKKKANRYIETGKTVIGSYEY